MRVIAGLYKGRPLKAPKGTDTRPTTDRVKESLMSSVLSLYGPLDGALVLDAFAGSGALGIECLSRGAATAHFFERDKAALAALSANVDMLKLPPERARIFRADVMKNPPLMGAGSYDLVFLDPPYAYDAREVLALVQALIDRGRLAQNALISYEHDASCNLEAILAENGMKLHILASKQFRGTVIDIMTRVEED